ncbi:MAG TPA: lasso peptide biosynthesis B2 protein [Vicinamibacterales bacterium]|jgi:hypothetical protein
MTRAVLVLLRVRLTLWLLPWPRAEQALARPFLFFNSSIRRFVDSTAVPDRARQATFARAVRRASRVAPGSSCLVQAIALKILLAHEGKVSVVRLGVCAPPRDRFLNAHAWLECDGLVLLGDPRGQYAAFPAIDLISPREPRLRARMPPQ